MLNTWPACSSQGCPPTHDSMGSSLTVSQEDVHGSALCEGNSARCESNSLCSKKKIITCTHALLFPCALAAKLFKKETIKGGYSDGRSKQIADPSNHKNGIVDLSAFGGGPAAMPAPIPIQQASWPPVYWYSYCSVHSDPGNQSVCIISLLNLDSALI